MDDNLKETDLEMLWEMFNEFQASIQLLGEYGNLIKYKELFDKALDEGEYVVAKFIAFTLGGLIEQSAWCDPNDDYAGPCIEDYFVEKVLKEMNHEAMEYLSSCASLSEKEVIQWLLKNGVRFSALDVSNAVCTNNYELVKFMVVECGFPFDYRAMSCACGCGNPEIIELFLQQGLKPATRDVDSTVIFDSLKAAELLKRYGYKCSRDVLRHVAKSSTLDSVEWLMRNKDFFEEPVDDMELERVYQSIVEWMHSQ